MNFLKRFLEYFQNISGISSNVSNTSEHTFEILKNIIRVQRIY